MSHTLVSLENIGVELNGRVILNDVTARLRCGEITALIGMNGSGKTTLLRTIIKEVPYRGTIRFHCGHDHSKQRPEHVGYVPQKLNIDANLPLTVADLLALALQRRPLFLGISRRTRARMNEMMKEVWLPLEILDKPVEKISGGELQRVLLSLALNPSPELLLLDEPAAGIDFVHAERFYDLLARLNRERGVTILLVSHDLSVVNQHAHHVLCLKDGQIECQGSPEEVMNQAGIRATFGADARLFEHHHHP